MKIMWQIKRQKGNILCKKRMKGMKYFTFLFKIDIITVIYATLTLQFYERRRKK